MLLPRDFYNRYTPKVAKDLLGCFLIREYEGKVLRTVITETEAYRGEYDLGCHASKGRTPRTETLYAEPGTAYVYLIYGMYWMLNVVTEEKNFPAAVLLRGVAIIDSQNRQSQIVNRKFIDGPGKLTKFLHIDRSLNGHDVTKGEKLRIESPDNKQKLKIIKSPRVGIDYAKHCKEWKWNFRII